MRSPYHLAVALALAGCGDNLAGPVDAASVPTIDAAVDAAPSPRLALYDYAQAIDVSPDGRLVLFGDVATADGPLHLLDTIAWTVTEPTAVGDALRDFATGLAGTGRISALHGVPVQAGLWTEADGWVDLPAAFAAGCDQDIAGAWDVSADGHVAVGLAWNGCRVQAFRWSDASGTGAMTLLDLVGAPQGGGPNPPNNRATVVSDDGAVAAGWASTELVDRAPAVWTADGTGVLLPRAAADAPGEVLAISADGATLAGLDGTDGVVWAGGVTTVIPRLDVVLPSDPVYPNAMTGDGAVVLGGQGDAFFGVPVAFVWTAAAGSRALDELVAAAGISVPPEIVLTSVMGASADGAVLVGTAFDVDASAPRTFALRLPAGLLASSAR